MVRARSIAALMGALQAILALAQPPPGYYDSAQGLTGPPLKDALHDIISPHTVRLYTQLWADMATTDERTDAPGKVWDIYSDDPDGPEPYLYTFGADQCGTYDEEGDCFNREHTVPQSWFDGQSPMVSDLFHIYPTDGWVNQKRGDLPYGRVGSIDFQSQNGTKTGNSTTPGYNGTVCEPIDAYKGDIARTYFYMMTRYQPNVPSWSSDMFTEGDLSAWAEQLLFSWHQQDPVSPKETDRNNAIYAIQVNRNPYIDHPEWVERIWGSTASVEDALVDAQHLWVADGYLYRSTITGPADVLLLDAAGRIAFSSVMNGTVLPLPTGLPTGIYVARSGSSLVRFVR